MSQKEMGKTDYRSGMLQGADGFHLPGDRLGDRLVAPCQHGRGTVGSRKAAGDIAGWEGDHNICQKQVAGLVCQLFFFPHSISYSMELIAPGHQ